jgi:hypothetical protein
MQALLEHTHEPRAWSTFNLLVSINAKLKFKWVEYGDDFLQIEKGF